MIHVRRRPKIEFPGNVVHHDVTRTHTILRTFPEFLAEKQMNHNYFVTVQAIVNLRYAPL